MALALGLGGCAGGAYPELRDMPSLPQHLTPAAERAKIVGDLKTEEAGAPAAPAPAVRQPAVPPKPQAALGAIAVSCDTPLAAGTLALRGTLQGPWRAPAAPPQGEGVTAALNLPGSFAVDFAAGTAELAPRDRARLKAAAARFLLDGGARIEVRTGAPSTPGGHAPLDGLSLGLKRASAIADVLVASGIAADRITFAAIGDELVPALAPAPDWGRAGADVAFVKFDLAAR